MYEAINNEDKNFEIINTETPIESNVNELKNNIDFSNIDNELKNIDLSYLNDDSSIVEPSTENTQKLFESDSELNNNIETLDFSEPIVPNSFEMESESEINSPVNEENVISNEESVSTFDTFEPTIDSSFAETVELPKTDDYSFNTIDTNEEVKPVIENDVRFTFDENGVVTSIASVDEPVKTEVLYDEEKEEMETPTIDIEKEDAISNINSNRDKINEEFDRLNKIIELAKETGIADSEYLKSTFEKMEIFDSVNQRFNKDLDDYIVSLNNDNLNNDAELSNMQF